jgi:hypothetical protein
LCVVSVRFLCGGVRLGALCKIVSSSYMMRQKKTKPCCAPPPSPSVLPLPLPDAFSDPVPSYHRW